MTPLYHVYVCILILEVGSSIMWQPFWSAVCFTAENVVSWSLSCDQPVAWRYPKDVIIGQQTQNRVVGLWVVGGLGLSQMMKIKGQFFVQMPCWRALRKNAMSSFAQVLSKVMGQGHRFGPLLIRSPNPRFLHGPFPVGDIEWPLSSWGYGLSPFRLGIPHPQKPVLSCRGPKGVWRRPGVKALLVFTNI